MTDRGDPRGRYDGYRAPDGRRSSGPPPQRPQPPRNQPPRNQPPQGQPPRGRQPGRGERPHQQAQQMPVPGRGQRGGPPPGATRQQARPPMSEREHRAAPPRQGGPAKRVKPRRRRPRFGRALLSLGMVFVLFLAAVWVYLEFSIDRVDALHDYPGRPPAAEGTNWLLVGSDSRKELTEQQQEKFNTGAAGGKRTDTILIAHIPDNDVKPTLLSIPRDSVVQIPGYGQNKVNAAFSLGGPELLAKTVEQATGLRMDHYIEIGFGGFAGVVNAVGGVEMTIPQRMHDTKTGVTIPAGRQTLNGAEALGFVRMRHSAATPRSDLDRIANQRKFIGALADEVASPGTFLNPLELFPLLSALPDAITLDDGDHLHNLVGLGWAMRGISGDGVVTTTVPVAGPAAEQWAQPATENLFDALRNDTPVPDSAIFQ